MSRKHCKRKVWPLVNPIAHAMEGAAVIDIKKLNRIQLLELSALDSFARGRATKADWAALADMVNTAETFATEGIGPEALPSIAAANEALGNAHRRQSEGNNLGFSGSEFQALREVAHYHHLQRQAVSLAEYERMLTKTANRIFSAHPDVKVYP